MYAQQRRHYGGSELNKKNPYHLSSIISLLFSSLPPHPIHLPSLETKQRGCRQPRQEGIEKKTEKQEWGVIILLETKQRRCRQLKQEGTGIGGDRKRKRKNRSGRWERKRTRKKREKGRWERGPRRVNYCLTRSA